MVDSRCGLHCTGCAWRTSHGCGGCIETMGEPFHGRCPIAACAQQKGLTHCGQCPQIPCDALYGYSYLDPEHGDKPQGARVQVCRNWAADEGLHRWSNVLLTSAGFEDEAQQPRQAIVDRFLKMLGMPVAQARVLFVDIAATDEAAKAMAICCREELLRLGLRDENIVTWGAGLGLDAQAALSFDVVYIAGGDTRHLLSQARQSGLDKLIKQMVYAGKVYVGVSAGSLIATPNIGEPFDPETAGLCLVQAYLSVHAAPGTSPKAGMPLPHIPLEDHQALAVRWDGYEMI